MTTTNPTSFAPTHEITAFDRSFPVQLLDGVAYTKEEWDADASGDWEVVDGEWLFQGRAITCSVRAIEQASKTESHINKILSRKGVRIERSPHDGSWATDRALSHADADALRRELEAAGVEASTAIDHDDRSKAWVHVTVPSVETRAS